MLEEEVWLQTLYILHMLVLVVNRYCYHHLACPLEMEIYLELLQLEVNLDYKMPVMPLSSRARPSNPVAMRCYYPNQIWCHRQWNNPVRLGLLAQKGEVALFNRVVLGLCLPQELLRYIWFNLMAKDISIIWHQILCSALRQDKGQDKLHFIKHLPRLHSSSNNNSNKWYLGNKPFPNKLLESSQVYKAMETNRD